MKLLIALSFLTPLLGLCQESPASWSFTAKRISDKLFEVRFKAVVKEPWHIYSQSSPEGGAVPTRIKFVKNPMLGLEGKTKEAGKIVSKYEGVFELTLKYFEGNAEFVQLVKLKSKVKTILSGTIEYMACTEEKCTAPLKESFSIPLQ